MTPVPAFFTSIVALATTAPELSVTVPEMVAVTCAHRLDMPRTPRSTRCQSVETEHFLVLQFEFIQTPFPNKRRIG